jgi:hypothetical protein
LDDWIFGLVKQKSRQNGTSKTFKNFLPNSQRQAMLFVPAG